MPRSDNTGPICHKRREKRRAKSDQKKPQPSKVQHSRYLHDQLTPLPTQQPTIDIPTHIRDMPASR